MLSVTWEEVKTGIKCLLDLDFHKRTRELGWKPEAGRSPDRIGLLFMGPSETPREADRFLMTAGPHAGLLFQLEGKPDIAASPYYRAQLELVVSEISQQEPEPAEAP